METESGGVQGGVPGDKAIVSEAIDARYRVGVCVGYSGNGAVNKLSLHPEDAGIWLDVTITRFGCTIWETDDDD